MFLLNILFIFIALLAFLYFWWMRRFQYWKNRGVPYVEPTFPAGTLRHEAKTDDAATINQNIYREMKGIGPFCGVYFSFIPAVFALEVEFIKRILVKDFEYFHDRGIYYNEKDDPLTAHLLTLEGQKWKNLRAKITPTFTSARMKYMFGTMIEIGHKLVEVLGKENPEKVEIKEILVKFTTDMIGSCAFGLECNSLEDPDSTFRKMGKLAIEVPRHNRLVQAFTLICQNASRYLSLKLLRDDVAEFFMGVVKDTVKYREENQVTRNDFIDILLKLKNEENLTINEMAAQCFVFFIAGFETSSAAMSYALFELAQNQEIQEKARKSVEEALEKHQGQWTYESINDMKYVDYCVQESMRKYPPIPNLLRVVTKEYFVPEYNVTFEKGTLVSIPVYSIHHDPEFYPNPDEFKPERFEPEEVLKRPQCSFLPFGEGPRNCIGLRFGLMQARIGLALLLKNFKFSLNKTTQVPVEFKFHQFLLLSKGGFYLDIEKIG